MYQEFPRQNWAWTPVVTIAGALVLAALLFLVIPFTQRMGVREEPVLKVREVVWIPDPLAAPPPIPRPPEPEPAKPPQGVATTPRAVLPSAPVPATVVEPLALEMSPGSGEAVAMGAAPLTLAVGEEESPGFGTLFTFDDLPEAPRLIHSPDFRFPSALLRRGISEGKVVVEIDILPDGTARLHRIHSASDRALEPVARDILARARFTRPIVDGRPHIVRGRFPLVLKN